MNEYVAIIGDVVKSRELQGVRRRRLQERLEKLLQSLNDSYADAIASTFLITTGDEFQGLLTDPLPVADLIWDIEFELTQIEVRMGIGRGRLDTRLRQEAIGMDGPVFHRARQGVELAEKQDRLGGVFVGFGASTDIFLNGTARLLRQQRGGLTHRQRQVVGLLRAGWKQTEIARKLKISKQAVNGHVHSAGWPAYQEGEAALRAALRGFPHGRRQPASADQ